jgi:hypothetical protein
MNICKAELEIADDYGDNHATMKCQLEKGHEGKHKEDFNRGIVEWYKDERIARSHDDMYLENDGD